MCNLLLTSGDQSMGRITCGVMSRRGELNLGRRIPSSESGKATPTENDVHFYNSTSSVFENILNHQPASSHIPLHIYLYSIQVELVTSYSC